MKFVSSREEIHLKPNLSLEVIITIILMVFLAYSVIKPGSTRPIGLVT